MREELKKYIKNYNSRFVMAYNIGISETALKNFLEGHKTKLVTQIKIENFLKRVKDGE